MRSNNQESRRIPVFPCQIVWPEQFRTRCGTHDGGRGSHLAFLFLENANKTSCRFPARDRAGQQDSLVKIHSTCFRLNALRARGVTPRGIFPPPPPLSPRFLSLFISQVQSRKYDHQVILWGCFGILGCRWQVVTNTYRSLCHLSRCGPLWSQPEIIICACAW